MRINSVDCYPNSISIWNFRREPLGSTFVGIGG